MGKRGTFRVSTTFWARLSHSCCQQRSARLLQSCVLQHSSSQQEEESSNGTTSTSRRARTQEAAEVLTSICAERAFRATPFGMVLVENYAAHHQRWSKCFNDPQMSDVVFEAQDGQTFHCEKFVLEVASPYFKKLFSSRNCGDHSKFVPAKDVEPSALKWVLRACYTGDGDLNDDNVVGVMVAAKMYEMDWVEKACMHYLKTDMGGPFATFEYSKENQKWQEWKVPETGWYHIIGMGAKAADCPTPSASIQTTLGTTNYVRKGGEGAIVGGSFELQIDDDIQILTGGMSKLWVDLKYPYCWTGGGGGTFVALKKKELKLLLAAGGGGSIASGGSGSSANLGGDGVDSGLKYKGGRNSGNGDSNGTSKGGLGWNAGPVALAKPKNYPAENGGFGGGGDVCGGGGGYSGGAAGSNFGGGGGGSCIAPSATNSWKRLGNNGHGKVFIWKGKEMPSDEMFLLRKTWNTEESLESWEVID